MLSQTYSLLNNKHESFHHITEKIYEHRTLQHLMKMLS